MRLWMRLYGIALSAIPGGFKEHDKRWVFQTMSCFSSGTGVRLGHCIIFCHALGSSPDMADATFMKPKEV